MKNEIWLKVIGYEDYYEVSNFGNIRSLDRIVKNNHSSFLKKGRTLKPCKTNEGYYRVNLSVKNKNNSYLLHRLVAFAFIKNDFNLPIINHKDENGLNNKVDNLEWCTYKYNSNYGTAIIKKNISLRETSCNKKVYQIDLNGNLIKEWKSTSEAGRNGYSQTKVSSCALGKRKTHKKYFWKYA